MNKAQEWINKNILGVDVNELKALTSFPAYLPTNRGNIPITQISDDSHYYVEEGYGANETVYSILTIAADKERMPPWAAYDIVDEGSLKMYEMEMVKAGTPEFSIKKALDFRTKALRLSKDSKLNKILEWPNENDTFSDLVANSGINKRATGKRFLKATLLDSGPNKGKPQELHLLPSQHVSIETSGTFPARIERYKMMLGTEHIYTAQEVMYDRLFNPSYIISADSLDGVSPLKAARMVLQRSRSSKIASVKSFDNLGPENILFAKDSRLSADESLAQLQATRESLNSLTGARNRKKTALSGYEMGALQLGVSPTDLALIDSEKWDVVGISNLFNFPHILLLPDHSTWNNLKEAEKALTTRCALPYLVSFRSHFNRKLRVDWGYKNEGKYVDFDLGVYSELQSDMGAMTEWLSKAWWLTPRMRYDIQQIEIPEAISKMKELDMVFIPSSLEELSKRAMNVEDPLNEYGNNTRAENED